MKTPRCTVTSRRLRALALCLAGVMAWLCLVGPMASIWRAQTAFGAPATITGKVDIVITNKAEAYQGATALCKATIHLPDGSTQEATGRCISGAHYAVPYDGTYDYVGTLQPNGTYSIIVHSQVSGGANAGSFKPGEMWGTQQMGDIHIVYQPEVRVSFTKTSANLELTEGNPSYRLEGASYDIHLASTGAKVASITTDAAGKASLMLKSNTAYYAVETKAPQGFVLNTQHIPFTTGDEANSVKFNDTAGTVTLNLVKVDSATHAGAQQGTSLEGAEFSISSTSTPGWSTTATTNAKGRLTVTGIPLGDIVITETKPPTGYLANPTPHKHHVSADQLTNAGTFELNARIENHPVAFDIELVKYLDSGSEGSGLQQPGAGIRFEIIANSSKRVVGSITTNAHGRASTADPASVNEEAVAPGATYDSSKPWMGEGTRTKELNGAVPYDAQGYTVREDANTTPNGYQPCPAWTISAEQMAAGATLHYIVDNDFSSSRIQILKTDAQTGLTIPRAGFSFQLLDEAKNPIKQEVWYPNHAESTTFTTDESGCVTFPKALKPGTYYIREVASIPPYVVDGKDIAVIVSSGNDIQPITVVRLDNKAAQGVGRIHKVCADDDCPQGAGLAGAEFDVVAQEDISSPTGSIQVRAGEIVDHVTTNDEGWAATKKLPLGSGTATYAFVETVPPAGHALNSTPLPFTLTYANDTTEVVTVEITATNAPSELKLVKTDAQTGKTLEGATFALWRADQHISVEPQEAGGLAIRAPKGAAVRAQRHVPHASITLEAPNDLQVTLVGKDGSEHPFEDQSLKVEEGSYTVKLARGKDAVTCKNNQVQVDGDTGYRLSVTDGLLGAAASLAKTGPAYDPITLSYHDKDRAHIAHGLAAGSWEIMRDGNSLGSIELADMAAFYSIDEGTLKEEPVLLTDGEPSTITTNAAGTFNVKHLTAGTYCLRETGAPKGYLLDRAVSRFTVDRSGLIDGKPSYGITRSNTFTTTDFTKRDTVTEEPLAGATLQLVDAEGATVDTWTTTQQAHRICQLEPGAYTLKETKTPQGHDAAEDMEITIEPTADVQAFAMHDKPIEITGELDKRQQIADPTAPHTEAQGSESNNADVTPSDEGRYAYTIDARNTSTTWVDEFTVTDTMQAVDDGLAVFEGLTTPCGARDYDGKLNVWYLTTKEVPGDGSKANATLDDGHKNPWLRDPSTSSTLGDDGRALSYEGWRLWRADVPTTEAVDLTVDDLGLDEGELVRAVCFEYGRVEKDFTTRLGDWDRSGLKSPHDDIGPLDEGQATDDDDTKTSYAPAIIRMRVTDAYTKDAKLTNQARVDLYRNGGGDRLEDHDDDEVTQSPRTPEPEPLTQTGTPPMAITLVVIACMLGGLVLRAGRRAGGTRKPRRI